MPEPEEAASKPKRRADGSRRIVEGANLAVYTLIGLALVVSANYFANRYSQRWDLTPSKKYSLSPQTLKLLKGLDRDVTLYIFDRKEGLREGRDLIENYSKAAHRLAVRYVDPDREPTLARQFAVRSYGTVVVAAGDRHFEAPGSTEEGITNALVRVLKTQKTVYFAQGHGERDLESAERRGYASVKKQLENENFQVKTVNLLEKAEVPGDCSTLVIAGPQKDYQPQEVDALRKYVKGGGRLLLMLDPLSEPTQQDPESLTKLLGDWKVTVHNDLVIEPAIRLMNADPGLTVVLKYGSSPIVEPLARTATLFPLSRSFALGKDSPSGVTDTSLCETSSASYGVADFNPKIRQVSYREGKDLKGPLSVAVSGTVRSAESASGGGEPKKEAEGRFVALGTSALVSNSYLSFEGNRDLFMNTVNWLSAEEDLISIRPKPPEAQHLTMTARQMDRAFYMGVIGLPLLIIAAGTSVWWRRR